jgi:bla regulator protein blaR1
MTWIIETMIATTVLMAAVLVLRTPVSRIFGARVAYCLWAAPLLRMILPPLPADWFEGAAAMAPAPSGDTVFANAAFVMPGPSSPAGLTDVANAGATAWPMLSLGIWLGGAALFFGWHCLSYRRFRAQVLAGAEILDAGGKIPVAASAAVSSPIAMGIMGRTVIVPADFRHRFDETEQRLALSHETAHHARGDLLINLAALVVLALHWFNPLAHLAHRAFRLDQEAACDALVLAGSSAEERHAYGTALFKSATGAMPLAVCAMGTATQLKLRLRRILEGGQGGKLVLAGMSATALLVLTGLGLTASTAIAERSQASRAAGTVIKGEKIVWQDPREATPSMIALNGVELDVAQTPATPETPVTPTTLETPMTPATPVTPAVLPVPPVPPAAPLPPYARAESAREAAEAEADRAQAEAERAQDMAEAARERAEAARERANAAAEAAADAATDAADAVTGTDLSVTCKKAHSRQVIARSDKGRRLAVVVCGNAIAAYTNATTRAALLQARADIAAMTDLAPEIRAKALESLDRSIPHGKAGKAWSLQ